MERLPNSPDDKKKKGPTTESELDTNTLERSNWRPMWFYICTDIQTAKWHDDKLPPLINQKSPGQLLARDCDLIIDVTVNNFS